ncbi:MAG TPA: hypothetical protein VGB85_29660 [Nannocystis sp.]|jgi:hypothetical protein
MSGGQSHADCFSHDSIDSIKESCVASRRHVIVLSDRPVKNTLGTLYHYSLEVWWSDHDVEIGKEYDNRDELSEACAKGGRLGGVELLRESGWRAYKYNRYPMMGPPRWQEESVALSVIHYQPSPTEFVPLYQGSIPDVSKKWRSVSGEAANYAYAEQAGVTRPQNWPNSIYLLGDDVNNSNTFIRHLVAKGGMTMKEMDGLHPGRMKPRADPVLYSAVWRSDEAKPATPAEPKK